MRINIYQIDLDKDDKRVAFMGFDSTVSAQNDQEINAEIYNRTFDGEVEAKDLEDVYRIFNIDHPDNYAGRSLSVSDVVEVVESDTVQPGFYFCDSIGFKEVSFDKMLTDNLQDMKITVVMVEPGKTARIAEIGTKLEDMQAAVEGCIEAFYPFEEEVCIVCNDEGKFNGSSPNRAVYGEDGALMDVIFGTFFVCDCSGPNFGSLSKAQQEKYLVMYRQPERIFKIDGEIKAVKYEPQKTAAER